MSQSKRSAVVENITPEMAIKYLEKNMNNRAVSDMTVRAFSEDMRRDAWRVTNQGIGFDIDGYLVDGQHRLWAIVESGVTVPMLVVRGLEVDARMVVDRGRGRSLADDLKMSRNMPHPRALLATLNTCVYLIAGTKVIIRTTGAFDDWMRVCEAGVQWAHRELQRSTLTRQGAVSGALAFAHKRHPEEINAFALAVRDGTGLVHATPAHALHTHLATAWHEGARGDIYLMRKVLRAAQLHVTGGTLAKLQDTNAGQRYFAEAYDTRVARKLTQPWLKETAAARATHEAVGAES